MLKLPHLLAEINSKVFETNATCRGWTHGDRDLGVQVTSRRHLDELTVSGFIALPDLTKDSGVEHHGILNLLTIARGRPANASRRAEFRNSTGLTKKLGGIYLQITYDPKRELIEVRKNVGNRGSKLTGVALEGAAPELICGRVLELHVEINRDRICVYLHDRFAGGDFLLQAIGNWTTETEVWPWGKSPSGHWWVLSGQGNDPADKKAALPAGFGLSNLRVVLASATDEAVGSLLYRGALDHLVADPPEGVAEAEIHQLTQHGKHLRDIATDLERIRLLLPIANPPAAAKTLEAAADAAYKAVNKALRKSPCEKSPVAALAQ